VESLKAQVCGQRPQYHADEASNLSAVLYPDRHPGMGSRGMALESQRPAAGFYRGFDRGRQGLETLEAPSKAGAVFVPARSAYAGSKNVVNAPIKHGAAATPASAGISTSSRILTCRPADKRCS